MDAFITALLVFVYYTFADVYCFRASLLPIKPLHWYLLTIGLVTLSVLVSGRFRLGRRQADMAALWGLGFAALSMLSFIWSSQSAVATQALITNMETMCLLIAFLYLFRRRRNQRIAVGAIVAAVITATFLIYVDFFLPSVREFTAVPGRGAGPYENPNIAGKYLVLGMVIAAWHIPTRLRWSLCLVVGTGVLLTFSRSSIIAWGLSMIALSWHNQFALPRRLSIGVTVALLAAVTAIMIAGQMTGLLESAGLGDRLTTNTIDRMTGSFLQQTDDSAQGRRLVAKAGINLFLESPIIGQGIGATHEWQFDGSTHNTYLMLAAEMGLVGVLFFLALLWILWSYGTPLARIVTGLYAVISLFTHNNLDQPAMMIVLALIISLNGKPGAPIGNTTSVVTHEIRRPNFRFVSRICG